MSKGNGVIPEEIVKLLNYRINQEEYAGRLYQAMSEWLEVSGFLGASKLWAQYSSEEFSHANWTYDYMKSHDYLPEVNAIEEVKTSYSSIVEVIKESYEEELKITKQCNDLAKECAKLGDYSTMQLANKYMVEQTEELDKFNRWVSRLVAMGNEPRELRLLDDEMRDMASGCIECASKSY